MSHRALENQMKSIISNLKEGETFMLKDIISDPPARLGRALYEGVQSGDIPKVKCIGPKDGVEIYMKL